MKITQAKGTAGPDERNWHPNWSPENCCDTANSSQHERRKRRSSNRIYYVHKVLPQRINHIHRIIQHIPVKVQSTLLFDRISG